MTAHLKAKSVHFTKSELPSIILDQGERTNQLESERGSDSSQIGLFGQSPKHGL